MPKNRLLVREEITTYAQVLLEQATQEGVEFEVADQLEEARKVFRSHPALRETVADAAIDDATRTAILSDVFNGYDVLLISTMNVMAQRGDLDKIERVGEEYVALLEEERGITILDVATVIELDDELREMIKTKCAPLYGDNIVLREHVDPEILGGINMSAHGKRIDACIATQLGKLRVALSSVSTGGER